MARSQSSLPSDAGPSRVALAPQGDLALQGDSQEERHARMRKLQGEIATLKQGLAYQPRNLALTNQLTAALSE